MPKKGHISAHNHNFPVFYLLWVCWGVVGVVGGSPGDVQLILLLLLLLQMLLVRQGHHAAGELPHPFSILHGGIQEAKALSATTEANQATMLQRGGDKHCLCVWQKKSLF